MGRVTFSPYVLAGLLFVLGPAAAAAQADQLVECSTKRLDEPLTTVEFERAALVKQVKELRAQKKYEEAMALLRQAPEALRDSCLLAQTAGLEGDAGAVCLATHSCNDPNTKGDVAHLLDAYRHFQEALQEPQSDWILATKDTLEEHLARVEQALQTVAHLSVRANVAGTAITLDGLAVGNAPLDDLPVYPAGKVELLARHAGYVSMRQSATLAPGELKVLTLQLEALPDPRRGRYGKLLLSSAGLGAVMALASIGPWLGASHRVRSLRADCAFDQGRDGCDDTTLHDKKHTISALDVTTNALLVSGISLTVLSIATYAILPSLLPRRASERVVVAPQASRHGVSASARLSF